MTKIKGTLGVLVEVLGERVRQDQTWGEQNHQNGTWSGHRQDAEDAKASNAESARLGLIAWGDILAEEFYEAMSEDDDKLLRAELIQVAAVAVAWVESIDRRHP